MLLIEDIKQLQESNKNPYALSALNTLQLSAEHLLAKEREQIGCAFKAGMDYESCEEGALSFTDYFIHTFTTSQQK